MRISDWSSDVCSSDLLRVGRAQPRAVDGDRRGAPFRDQPRATPAPVGARGPVGQTPQPRLRGGIAYRARVQLAESKPGVHMAAHAMKPHYLSIAIPLLFTAAGASLDARAAGPLTFVNETSQRIDALPDSAYRFDAVFVDFTTHDIGRPPGRERGGQQV